MFQVFASLADVPEPLRASAAAVSRPCNASFTKVNYIFVAYIWTPILMAPFGVVLGLFLAFDLAYVLAAHRRRLRAGGKGAGGGCGAAAEGAEGGKTGGGGAADDGVVSAGGREDERGPSAVVVTADDAPAGEESLRDRLCCCCCPSPASPFTWAGVGRTAAEQARAKWPWLLVQAVVVLGGYAAVIAVDITWRTCQFRPSPVFGPG